MGPPADGSVELRNPSRTRRRRSPLGSRRAPTPQSLGLQTLLLACLLLGWNGPAAALPPDGSTLERLRERADQPGGRRAFLEAAHDLLHRYWLHQAGLQMGRPAELQPGDQPEVPAGGQTASQGHRRPPHLTKPVLLLAGDPIGGCGRGVVRHPMAFYCPTSGQIALGLDLRRGTQAARGKDNRALLAMDLAVLAHEWGHHVNRSLGLGPYQGGLNLTVKQEEQAADWRCGTVLGWLLSQGWLSLDDVTDAANLLFEIGDYERITPQHHGYPKDRFQALTRGLATQLKPGQRLGPWTVDTPETFSKPLPSPGPEGAVRRYAVRRFEIDREGQIATNLIGAALGAASCLWGSSDQCLGMGLQQGKGRAYGHYTSRELELDCRHRRFDVGDDPFGPQPLERDGKGQAPLLAQRDCPAPSPPPL